MIASRGAVVAVVPVRTTHCTLPDNVSVRAVAGGNGTRYRARTRVQGGATQGERGLALLMSMYPLPLPQERQGATEFTAAW